MQQSLEFIAGKHRYYIGHAHFRLPLRCCQYMSGLYSVQRSLNAVQIRVQSQCKSSIYFLLPVILQCDVNGLCLLVSSLYCTSSLCPSRSRIFVVARATDWRQDIENAEHGNCAYLIVSICWWVDTKGELCSYIIIMITSAIHSRRPLSTVSFALFFLLHSNISANGDNFTKLSRINFDVRWASIGITFFSYFKFLSWGPSNLS